MSTASVTHRYILAKAWPIVLANASAPLLGLVDTAVIGNIGSTADLGAIALGALVFSFVYWSFGFLRMGTTGFTSQATGAGDEIEVRATLGRSLLIAAGLGLVLIISQRPIATLSFALLSGSEPVESIATGYFVVRIWGAPATLATFALMGTLIGLAKSRQLLLVQLFLNGLNALLDVVFAGMLGLGVKGIALGTVIAEWSTLVVAGSIVLRTLSDRNSDRQPFWPWARVADTAKVLRTLKANRDIMIRTLLLVFSFAWFTDQSARFGDTVLAANHILLQLVSFSAFFLDGYAFVAESLVGAAVGSKQRDRFDIAVRRSTELAVVTALLLAVSILWLGDYAVFVLTDLSPVRQQALDLLPLAALYVFLAVAAFQLDGIFVGATFTRQMRNASAVAVTIFLLTSWVLVGSAGVVGLWYAFTIYVCARAGSLLLYYPALKRSIA